MVLRIYGSPRSRTMRTLWMANELGLDYEHKPLEWSDPFLKSAEFLALNPAGSIPTIVDDGFALAESMAINLYLAKRYGLTRGLYPATLQGEAEVWRWCLWAQGHIEPWVQRDEAVLEVHDAAPAARSRLLEGAMTSLERALASSSWLI
jgi:glutathione S-transferase